MKPFTNPLPKPPPPSKQRPFDPWNSSSTGHQRREAPRLETEGVTETGWRASRTLKLNRQFTTQPHVVPPPPQDAAAAAAAVPPAKSVIEMLVRPGSMKDISSSKPTQREQEHDAVKKSHGKGRGNMFDGLVVYVNGSTFPVVSDHKLKTVLAEHGARISLHLARRQVTHVILGRPAGGGGGGGGGLAGTKMDKEIRRIGGHGIKYVVLLQDAKFYKKKKKKKKKKNSRANGSRVTESIRAGRRLPETRFSNLKIAAHGQSSVYNLSRKPA
ncbi:hypothetical protein PWT90_10382 [Aphanocladium album]|nr:hypothetical protein PWT90_10382 [Aphanocladium album]